MSPDPTPPKPPGWPTGSSGGASGPPKGGAPLGRGETPPARRRDAPPRPPLPASPAKKEPETGPRTVTKKELVARIADRTAQTKVIARDIIQLFLDEIIRELGKGNRLEFREFGVFEIKERAARRAQNPRTLEKVDVPAKRVVKFRVGRTMKERVGEIPEGAEHIADGSDSWHDDEEEDD